MTVDLRALADPFDPSAIHWKPGVVVKNGQGVILMAYIDARNVMDRLDEVVGPENWTDEYRSGADGGVTCRLSIRVVHADGTAEWVHKEGSASNTDIEAVKGGESDSFKRAAVKWGVGRYLYKLDAMYRPVQQGRAKPGKGINVSQKGRHLGWCDLPTRLPDWAMPSRKPKTPQRYLEAEEAEPPPTRPMDSTEEVTRPAPLANPREGVLPDDGWGPSPDRVGAAFRVLGVTLGAANHFGPKVQDAPDANADPQGHAEAVAKHIRDHCRKQWHALRSKATRGDPAPSRWGDTQRAAWTRAHYGVEGLSALSMSQTLDLLRRMGAAKTPEAREALFGMEREKP